MANEGAARALVMVIDDEPNMCRILEKSLTLEGYAVAKHTDPRAALTDLDKVNPDVVLSDLLMPHIGGMEVLEAIKRHDGATPVIIITAHGSISGAVDAIKAGAFDFVTKPFVTDELLLTIERALEFRRLEEERRSVDDLWNRSQGDAEPVGVSAAWREMMEIVEQVAPTSSAILIQGETGVGKEIVARWIHQRSPRAGARLAPVNCAAIPETLLESELFGHEKGAFTGAVARKLGLFELANRGTLFLDEIGDMPAALQAKLLRVLQDQRLTRVGGTHEIAIDARIVAATHRDLAREIEDGRFREDLYYRLNVITIRVPPLRERREDVAPLARVFIADICAKEGREAPALAEDACDALRAYDWPGNVRELRNVIERTLALFKGPEIGAADVRADLGAAKQSKAADAATVGPTPNFDDLTYQQARDRFERAYIESLLRQTDGNVTAAARQGGMSRRNLYEKIEKLGMDVSTFKTS